MKSPGAAGPMVGDMGSMYMNSPRAAGPMAAGMNEWKVENEKESRNCTVCGIFSPSNFLYNPRQRN